MRAPNCTIDANILNKDTLANMEDIAMSFFASTCGKNRGAFVLDPPDGQTYGWYVVCRVGCAYSECEQLQPPARRDFSVHLQSVSILLTHGRLFAFAFALLFSF